MLQQRMFVKCFLLLCKVFLRSLSACREFHNLVFAHLVPLTVCHINTVVRRRHRDIVEKRSLDRAETRRIIMDYSWSMKNELSEL